jgi:NADPH:quinone reductase-like Zn-dependent oxidoreductase
MRYPQLGDGVAHRELGWRVVLRKRPTAREGATSDLSALEADRCGMYPSL